MEDEDFKPRMLIDLGDITAVDIADINISSDIIELDDDYLKRLQDLIIEQSSSSDTWFFIASRYRDDELKRLDLKNLTKAIYTKISSGDISILNNIELNYDYDIERVIKLLDVKSFIKALTKAREVLSNNKSSDNKNNSAEIEQITEFIEFFEQKLNDTTEQGLNQ